MKTYMHSNGWSGTPEGFYEPAEVLKELSKAFDAGLQAACEGDIDCDGDCDGSDASLLKRDFGRNLFKNSCASVNPCTADFDCEEMLTGAMLRSLSRISAGIHFLTIPVRPVWRRYGAAISKAEGLFLSSPYSISLTETVSFDIIDN